IYESHLVPLIFEPYAQDVVPRLRKRGLKRVLEIAAGTGVVTRAMASQLPAAVEIVATDLNPGMLEEAARRGTARPVTWRQADALALPFGDREFDAIVCQFGAMFFPDKVKAFGEARRVLKPGGVLVFSVWDRLEDNEFAATVTSALADFFPQDPPRFLARTPHGYCDHATIHRDVAAAGFARPATIDTVTARSRASSPDVPAIAYCQGTPLRSEIDARDPAALARATAVAAQQIGKRFGTATVEGRIQALVVTVEA
ncbi:MAG TPA: class I SAM-dependent methyltransferase, partial [Nevskiaceae bacterium]|nr:class I SAM-dependent methyltransferase [Nevskiaceae bacterium]